jgi:excisionase family DNA binding protein
VPNSPRTLESFVNGEMWQRGAMGVKPLCQWKDAHELGSARGASAFEVAEFVGCHEETIRRAYLRGLLTSQRFGVRGRRFHPADVHDWISRGAPTRVSWQLEGSPSNL